MDTPSERISLFLHQYGLPLGIGVLGLIFLGYGLIVFFGQKDAGGEMVFESTSGDEMRQSQTASSSANERQIVVDVEGAVQKPGVYELPHDARVQDALVAAGGMSDQADRNKVSQGLNLAAALTDGAKIYIPLIGELATVSGGGSTGTSTLGTSTGLININTASSSELDTLKGIGPVTAEKIIENRPYNSIDELLTKKVVGQKVFTEIKEKITVY